MRGATYTHTQIGEGALTHMPTAWKTYISRARESAKPVDPSSKQFAALSRFAARYRVAHSVASLTFDGISSGTADAYFAALRVTLAYTALEALETALGAEGSLSISNPRITAELRSANYEGFMRSLIDSNSNSKTRNLKAKLLAFQSGESDDLRAVVYAIRNLMSHGTLTAERLGIGSSEKRRQLLHRLADAALETADERFNRFVQKGKFK